MGADGPPTHCCSPAHCSWGRTWAAPAGSLLGGRGGMLVLWQTKCVLMGKGGKKRGERVGFAPSALASCLWQPSMGSEAKGVSIPTLHTRTRQPGLFSLLAVSRKEKKPHTTPKHPTRPYCSSLCPSCPCPPHLHPPCGHLQKAPVGQSSPKAVPPVPFWWLSSAHRVDSRPVGAPRSPPAIFSPILDGFLRG